jgi:cytoskeletal protein RodZ
MSVTQFELEQLHRETEQLEIDKNLKQAEREAKKQARKAKRRRELLSKLVAPVLFIITVLVALALSKLR